jgi:hypothetical protein
MTTRSVRTQLLVGIGGVVMLTVLLFASAVWRLILRPAEDELAARDMRYAATAASAQVRGLVEGVEHIVETARQWGRNGQLSIGGHEEFDHLILPLIRNRPEIDAVLFASEDGQEIFLLRTERGWDNRLTDVAKRPAAQRWVHWDRAGGFLAVAPGSLAPSRSRATMVCTGPSHTCSSPAASWASPRRVDGPIATPASAM